MSRLTWLLYFSYTSHKCLPMIHTRTNTRNTIINRKGTDHLAHLVHHLTHLMQKNLDIKATHQAFKVRTFLIIWINTTVYMTHMSHTEARLNELYNKLTELKRQIVPRIENLEKRTTSMHESVTHIDNRLYYLPERCIVNAFHSQSKMTNYGT